MFKLFKEKKEPENIKEVLTQLRKLKTEYKKVLKELKNIKEQGKSSVQKVGVIRFNPFKEIGGNQSFSIALLDGNDDGVVITSFYSRDGNRVFAKSIKNGKSKHSLSKEEQKAIKKAQEIEIPETKNKNDNKK